MSDVEPVGGVFKVIEAHELEEHTRNEWALAKVLPTTVNVGCRHETVTIPASYQGGYPTSQNNLITEYGMGHRFLVCLSPNQLVAELNDTIGRNAVEIREQEKQLKQFADDAKQTQKDLLLMKSLLDSKEGMYQRALAESRQWREKFGGMETDLSKVRKDIGEREYVRIVGEKQ